MSRDLPAGAARMIDGAGIFPGMPDAVYHADPVTHGSLSSTPVRRILTATPAHALDGIVNGREDTDAFDRGRALHREFLGTGAELAVYPGLDKNGEPVKNWQTKAAQEFRAEARAAGHAPLLKYQHADVVAAVEVLRSHPYVHRLMARAVDYELTAVGQDPETGLWVRGRLDWAPVLDGSRMIVLGDYKSSGESASVQSCQMKTWQYRYDVQGVHMIRALQWAGAPVDPLSTPYVLIFQEVSRPYAVNVVELDEAWMRRAVADHDRALRQWADCLASGRWPAYGDDVVLISAPRKADFVYEGEE